MLVTLALTNGRKLCPERRLLPRERLRSGSLRLMPHLLRRRLPGRTAERAAHLLTGAALVRGPHFEAFGMDRPTAPAPAPVKPLGASPALGIASAREISITLRPARHAILVDAVPIKRLHADSARLARSDGPALR